MIYIEAMNREDNQTVYYMNVIDISGKYLVTRTCPNNHQGSSYAGRMIRIKHCLILGISLFSFMQAVAQTVSITEAGGWLETAHVQWLPVGGAKSCQVSYSGEEIATGTAQARQAARFSLYPNPVEDILYLRSNAMVGRADIYRMTGTRVSSISGPLSSQDMRSVESSEINE
jgi:hypothetical protein